MATRYLSKPKLLSRIVGAIAESGWTAFVLSSRHPFQIVIQRSEESFRLRVHVWNCTPGGKNRPKDEYRIQIKSNLVNDTSAIILLLGWHEGYNVFVGYDFAKHKHQKPESSPSIQVKEENLVEANTADSSTYRRTNKEIVFVFKSFLFCDYAIRSKEIHDFAEDEEDIAALRSATSTQQQAIDEDSFPVTTIERRIILKAIRQKIRSSNFSFRVLSAYDRKCAMCGIQLKLVDAAHIVPVADDNGSDETSNGIALCALHHRAFDNGLIFFGEDYKIHVNESLVSNLKADGLANRIKEFRSDLRPMILLPVDQQLRPHPSYVKRGRQLRGV